MKTPYKTVCDHCYRGTWYETEQPCKHTITPPCPTCGSYEHSKPIPCPGTLRVINRSNLAPQFARYHESGQRIIVKMQYGEILRGYVGITTGWKPRYLLLKKSNSTGSSETLSEDDKIIGTIDRYR